MRRSKPASTTCAGELEGGRQILARDRLGDVELDVAADQAEHGAHIARRDGVVGERQNLIERRERVAHAALGRSRDERQRGVVHLDALAGGDRP